MVAALHAVRADGSDGSLWRARALWRRSTCARHAARRRRQASPAALRLRERSDTFRGAPRIGDARARRRDRRGAYERPHRLLGAALDGTARVGHAAARRGSSTSRRRRGRARRRRPRCSGWFAVDGRRHAIDDAPGLQKHIWGNARVQPGLYWLACPSFTRTRARASRRRRASTWGGAAAVAGLAQDGRSAARRRSSAFRDCSAVASSRTGPDD